jgi:mono/diheme cytochrome c family protein
MRILYMTGQLELVKAEVIKQDAPRSEPPAGATAEYGQYLVTTTCQGCHGAGLSGGPIPGADPSWPPAANITADKATGLGSWTQADFVQAMRLGKRPNGDLINPIMPWPDFASFTDDELTALWLYSQSLPAKAKGNR